MKRFFIRVLILIVPIVVIVLIGLFARPSQSEQKSLLYAQPLKDSLMAATPGPRVILIGGSNLSFGIDSKMIKDSLHVNVVNTAINAGIGLKYMLKHAEQYIRKDDIIIVSGEYQQYYGETADGDMHLLILAFDVAPQTKNLIAWPQYFTLMKYIPDFIKPKLIPQKAAKVTAKQPVDIYDKESFNAFGDTYVHWAMKKRSFKPLVVEGDLNNSAFKALTDFRTNVEQKHAQVFVTFPSYQQTAFRPAVGKIKKMEELLKTDGFKLLGTPERYMFNDSLMFNTSYHLTREGVTRRTNLLISDIRKSVPGFNK